MIERSDKEVCKYWNQYPTLDRFSKAVFDTVYQPHQLFLTEANGATLAYRFGHVTGRTEFWMNGVNWRLLNNIAEKFLDMPFEEKAAGQRENKALYTGLSDMVGHNYCITRQEYIKLDAAQHHATIKHVGKLPPWMDLTYLPESVLKQYQVYGLPIMTNAEYDTFDWMKQHG